MYKSFYGLKTSPFKISTDPTFLWLGEKHREAISMLKYGVMGDGHSGILLLTGEAGTGKTTLINALFKSLGRDVIRVAITNPNLDGLDFLNYIAASFGSKKQFASKSRFLIAFEQFLKNANKNGKKVLLVIDEAQLLTDELLEEIRLFSNFNEDGQSLIHTFLIGQQALRHNLSTPRNKSLRQRITLNYHIDALVAEETDEYIRYRLQVAGTAERIFNPDAVREIHRYGAGLPRQINIICDHALLTGYVQNIRQITIPMVQECVRDLSITQFPERMPPPQYQPPPYAAPYPAQPPYPPHPPYQPPPHMPPPAASRPEPGPGSPAQKQAPEKETDLPRHKNAGTVSDKEKTAILKKIASRPIHLVLAGLALAGIAAVVYFLF